MPEMTTVYLDSDEFYPWWLLLDERPTYPRDGEIEVDVETLARWRGAIAAAEAVMEEISDARRRAGYKDF